MPLPVAHRDGRKSTTMEGVWETFVGIGATELLFEGEAETIILVAFTTLTIVEDPPSLALLSFPLVASLPAVIFPHAFRLFHLHRRHLVDIDPYCPYRPFINLAAPSLNVRSYSSSTLLLRLPHSVSVSSPCLLASLSIARMVSSFSLFLSCP